MAAAVNITMGAVSKPWGWMKSIGVRLVTAVKASKIGHTAQKLVGWWSKQNAITQGAITNASSSGIQTARHGGSFSDILRSLARGAVDGAVGAAAVNFLNGLKGSFFLHMAAHGVAGGAMSVANGGSFKVEFVGRLAGFGIDAAFAGVTADLGDTTSGVAIRTTLSAVSGGAASRATGGSFADGAGKGFIGAVVGGAIAIAAVAFAPAAVAITLGVFAAGVGDWLIRQTLDEAGTGREYRLNGQGRPLSNGARSERIGAAFTDLATLNR